MGIFVGKNLKLLYKILLIDGKLFISNIFKTKFNSEGERVQKCPFLHNVMFSLQNVIEKKKKNHIEQKYLIEHFEIFHQQMHSFFRRKKSIY